MSNINHNKTYSFYIIYKTTCIVNQKYYIGCHATDNIDDGYLGSGTLLKRAIKKYGKENFTREILLYLSNSTDMFNKEKTLVNESIVNDKTSYNLVIGGSGGFKIQNVSEWKNKLKIARANSSYKFPGVSPSAETREKISKSLKGRPSWNKGLPGTFTNKSHSSESKQKISKSRKGLTAGKDNPMYGKSAVKGRKWYNNGIKTFYLFPDDPLILELNLVLGRKF